MKFAFRLASLFLVAWRCCVGCAARRVARAARASPDGPNVLAVETFLADIAQNVAGDRLTLTRSSRSASIRTASSRRPPTSGRWPDSSVLIVNGAGVEAFLNQLLQKRQAASACIEASTGPDQPAAAAGRAPGGEADHAQRKVTRTSGWTRPR